MEKSTNDLKKHLLICTRTKEGKECCGAKNSQSLVDELKTWIKQNNLKDSIKVTGTQCLGHCEEGITAFLYPDQLTYTEITVEDSLPLKQILQK